MEHEKKRAVILGATGPTGRSLCNELMEGGYRVRVVARSAKRLKKVFDDSKVEVVEANLLDPNETDNAVQGQLRVFDCLGFPVEQMDNHPRTARNIAAAIRKHKTECVQISSFWSYIPIKRHCLNENHPRENGDHIVQMRREAENILQEAGAAIAQLPDFFGPNVHVSTLQNALTEAHNGKTVNWIGSLDVKREYIYVPDAMRVILRLSERSSAYGKRWLIGGPAPISGNQILEIVETALKRKVKGRGANKWMLKFLSVFTPQLRPLVPLLSGYIQPLEFDTARLKALLGEYETTPHEIAIPKTLQWLEQGR